ncbi:hypothetical protein GALMADRAFT_265823 [Galerina marginata CBS 339.88]|uniref:EF-hand domain-containing protein n=1 Tax=Galerina marginata (strain CBS 339.88) TaxID=685588 RepID=A0A067T899_GALM3|nr:hypothetical protein GALMADRAFT_265823 [Galerina marginata CBS 339.88]
MDQFPAPANTTSFSDIGISSRLHVPDQDQVISTPLTLDQNQEQLWQDLTHFFAENEPIIERSLSLDPEAIAKGEKSADLILAVDSWVETANVVLEGLVALGNVHPVLGVAIFAFHSVVSLDLSRRENDRKVFAVKLQMQNMMCTMFQLRKLRHEHVQERDKEQEITRMQRLVKVIADDIMKCGSDLNYYVERKLVSKLINAKKYERRFADHIQKFVLRRSELQSTISAYTAAGIDAANLAIQEVGQKLDTMDQKLETAITALFRKLDTPREQAALKFVEDHGGPKACISKDELLTGLLVKTGQSPEASKAAVTDLQEIGSLRKELMAELMENLDEVLAKSVSRFEKQLAVQYNNLELEIMDQGQQMQDHGQKLDKIISTSILILEEGRLITKGVPVKLKDPELQQIWNQMGLKKSVKAKNFVLTLRDHLAIDHSMPGTPYAPSPLLLSSTRLPGSEKPHSDQLKPEDSDEWVFDFINVSHVQPVVEAMDEDGSGFINVKEANKFALSRPKGLSLLHWIAYWAAGWHINITNYRTKLYSIMLEMHEVSASVHLVNRAYVGYYLNHDYFQWIEGLLRSIKPLPSDARKQPKLSEVAASMATLQEGRLLTNLKAMSFVIESPSDVNLIAGSGRVETWILPLLYLILTRHLEIIKLAEKRVLNTNELGFHTTSIGHIFSVFDARMRNLNEIFLQTNRDIESQFANHAYGMFLTFFKKTAMHPALNTLFTVNDIKVPSPPPASVPNTEPLDTSILFKGLGPSFEFEEVDLKPSEAPPEHNRHSIEGEWIGVCICSNSPDIAFRGSFQFIIGPVVDGMITGKGVTYASPVSIEGKVGTAADGCTDGVVSISLTILEPHCSDIVCEGQFDPGQKTIKGTWSAKSTLVDGNANGVNDNGGGNVSDSQGEAGHLYIAMISPDIFRFRYFLDGPSSDPSWTIARKRWAFAIKAVLFQTQSRMGSWDFFKARISERRRWIELYSREMLDDDLPTTRGFMTNQQEVEYSHLCWSIPPNTARIYEKLASYLHPRLVYFLGENTCDVCDQRVVFTRLVCITCMNEDMSNYIDLCPECTESRVFSKARTFVHHLSHSLIRTSRAISKAELPIIVLKARLLSERIKASVKASEDKKNSTKDRDSKALKGSDHKATKNADTENIVTSRPTLTPLICASCSKDVTLPCWACIACALDTLICLDCERQGRFVPPREGISGTHSVKHLLLRINDSADIKTVELKASKMEMHLSNMEKRLNAGIDEGLLALENKMNTQSEIIRKEVNDIANTLKNPPPGQETGVSSNEQVEPKAIPEGNSSPAEDPLQAKPISPYESRLEERMNALEVKVDTHFGRLLDMMEEVLRRDRSPSHEG